MFTSCVNRLDIHKLFPIPCRSYETSGIQDGIIVRFKTFYLKIYDDRYSDGYNVQGFRFDDDHKVFDIHVMDSKFKEFANQFKHDDYLCSYLCKHQQCGHRCKFTR